MDPLLLFWSIGLAILIFGLMLHPLFLIVGIVTLISYFIFGVEIASLIGGIALLIVFATRIGGPH